MVDTQWPRFQVFVQEKDGAPHQDYGSVHAPDPEMALLNARDVFARRPECVSMWVVPSEAIFSKTAEELGSREWQSAVAEAIKLLPEKPGDLQPYFVFCKARPAGTQILAGKVEATSAVEAMRKAVREYSGQKTPFAWWVFPARLVVRSNPEDFESMYAPARDKHFRMSTDFHTVSAMRQIQKGQE